MVAKLFNIVQPHVAIFGEKDYQQLIAIRQMGKDINFDIDIIGAPIFREEDGLAMSSRNKYLSLEERKAALCLVASLRRAENLCQNGEVSAEKIIEKAAQIINAEPLARIDYIKICNPETIEETKTIDDKALMALAVKIGGTRLIDNRILKRT